MNGWAACEINDGEWEKVYLAATDAVFAQMATSSRGDDGKGLHGTEGPGKDD